MNDLISRSALLKTFRHDGEDESWDFSAIETEIASASTVDAVEVVRCKECIKRHTSMCHAEHEQADMDFCSHGEHRESEGKP